MILVANPSTHPELRHLARHALATGGSVNYLTATFLPSDSWAGRIVSHMPPSALRDRILPSEFAKGTSKTFAFGHEVFFQLAKRYFPSRASEALGRRDAVFVRRSTAWASELQPHAVIANQGNALELFQRAPNAMKILNYPIAYWKWADALLDEEKSANSRWSNYLQFQTASEAGRIRLDQELQLSDRVLVGSEFVKNSFIEEGFAPEKLLVCRYGVDTGPQSRPISYSPDRDRFNLLFVGQVNQRKGVGYLLEALDQLPHQNWTLRIAGPISPEMRQTALSFRRVEVLGALDKRALGDQYEWCHALVLPSLVEGFALSPLEAMSQGRPVLVSDHTGTHEIIKDGVDGFTFRASDVASLRETIETAINTPDIASMGVSARHTAEKYSWDRYGDQAVAILNELLG